jgi:uncharacterized membrane protein HdeD (DUF308 family)
MGERAVPGDIGTPPATPGLRGLTRELTRYWWLSLIAGISWIIVAVAILQFDETSVRTVGLIVGFMFLFAGFQNLALAAAPIPLRWVWVTFGFLLVIAGIVSLANLEDTFAGLADMLSFLFLLVGLWWIVRAFLEQAASPLWWLGLISGVLMTVLAFWTAGQFFIEKAYVLLVFAGIWALLEGVGDIVRAFDLRALNREA